jgi:ubiquinone/menaquinone biosynthesis C-methylase UbiE
MSVAEHLGIELRDYDRRIRTFIPYYEEILDTVGDAVLTVRGREPTIMDLGIGTGALAQRCLAAVPRANLLGIDADPGILAAARRRLRRYAGRLHLTAGNFLKTSLPRCEAVVATLALHHIRSAPAKERFYRRCRAALSTNGILVTGDVFLAHEPALRERHFAIWREHMERSYSPREARQFLKMWSAEDRYLPLETELQLLKRAGFRGEVAWRRPPFGVIVARKTG